MFKRLNIDEERNNRKYITPNSNNLRDNHHHHNHHQQERNKSNQYQTERDNRSNTEQKIFQKSRKKSSSPNVDCLEQTELFYHSAHDKQLIDWIKNNLDRLGIDPIYNTSLILALLNKTSLQDSPSTKQHLNIGENNRPDLLREDNYSNNRARYCDNSVYRLYNSREKLFVNDRKTVNNHQAPSSTTKFMHKRYQDSVSFQNQQFQPEEYDEDSHYNLDRKSREVSEKLLHYLKDATAQDSAAIESFVNELLERFERAATGVAQQHHSEWMLSTDMDQKRRPISNNEFGSKSIQSSNGNNTSLASVSSNNQRSEDSWHRNTGRTTNFRSINQDNVSNQTSNLKNHDAHKYFNAFPALSDERAPSQSKNQSSSDHSANHNRASKSSHGWNGMKIIKNVVEPGQGFGSQSNNSINDNTNFTTLTSKSGNSFAGKQRMMVTSSSTNKNDKSGEVNNMVTLRKVSTGKKSGISNSPARYETNASANSKLQFEVSSKKKITKEDEKILSVMPNFMNPLKKNDGSSSSSGSSTTTNATVTNSSNNANNEQYRSKDEKQDSWNSSARNAHNQQDISSPSGTVRTILQHELTQKQREFFDSKFVKRSNSFGTREMKKYGFTDESKKKNGGSSSLRNNNNSQPPSDDIDSDWRAQKTSVATPNKNPLSASNALVGIMPSYLKSVATADAEKVRKIEHKNDISRSNKIASVSQQEESSESCPPSATSSSSTARESTTKAPSTSPSVSTKPIVEIETKSLITMSSAEISKFWNDDSNFKFCPMFHEGIFEDDVGFQKFLTLEKEFKSILDNFKSIKKHLKPTDSDSFGIDSNGPAESTSNENNAIDNLMQEMDNLALKPKPEVKVEHVENVTPERVHFVPYSKRKKYENGGAEKFGEFPFQIEELESERIRLHGKARFDHIEMSASSNEDLSIAYMFEREPDYDVQFTLEEGYEEAHDHHHHIMIYPQNDGENDADLYANDYENFLAETQKATAEAGRIGFKDFATENRFIGNTIDSVQKSQKPCKYLLEGFCARSDCKFSHNFSNIVCRYWLEGFCAKELDCPFKHSIDESSQRNLYQSPTTTAENYELDIDGDFPALAKNNVQNQQNSSDMIGNPYFNNHNNTQNGKNVADEWPTLDMNGGRQTQAYSSSAGNIYPSTMDSFGINFKVAKKKNRKDKSKFKN